MSKNVSIVIVSHSEDIARGTEDMVRQMIGDEVKTAYCGGNIDGKLGTDVEKITKAIEKVYSDKGVVVLVDLGGAETNSEMAIELMDERKSCNVMICNAPIVEGAVMAATEASSGSDLATVCKTAEDIK